MNAKIGGDSQHYERIVMGKYAIRERNDKGERRCNICHNNKLVITVNQRSNIKRFIRY